MWSISNVDIPTFQRTERLRVFFHGAESRRLRWWYRLVLSAAAVCDSAWPEVSHSRRVIAGGGKTRRGGRPESVRGWWRHARCAQSYDIYRRLSPTVNRRAHETTRRPSKDGDCKGVVGRPAVTVWMRATLIVSPIITAPGTALVGAMNGWLTATMSTWRHVSAAVNGADSSI